MSRRNNVFLNCPFDVQYKKLFRAIVFTVLDCKFDLYCALNQNDSGHVRIDKIHRMIGKCRLGIHDISRTELDKKSKLPRFNMPFELGLYLGAKRFGKGRQKEKVTLILDKESHRYQKFISDISGQDIHSHKNKPERAIQIVRDWLQNSTREDVEKLLPSGRIIAQRYNSFSSELPHLCSAAKLDEESLTHFDFMWVVRNWLLRNALV